ncbi:MAG: lipopolysaccharide biosynthesis protein [Waterburya sp.]
MKNWLFSGYEQPVSIVSLFTSIGIVSGLQISGIVISYSCQIFLARWLGATEYGTYDYIINLSIFLSYLAGLGLPNALLRLIPEYEVKKDWGRLQGLIWNSWLYIAIASILLSIIVSIVVVCLGPKVSFKLPTMLFGIWTIPLLALLKQQLEMAKVLNRFILAYLPSVIIAPILLIVGIFCLQNYLFPITSTDAIAVFLVSLFILLAVQLWLFCQKLPQKWFDCQSIYVPKEWLSVSLPFLLGDGAYLILNQADIFMIGAFLDPKQVGIYSAALKTAGWVNILLTASSTVLATTFSSLYFQGKQKELQDLLTKIIGWIFVPALIASCYLFIFGDDVLVLFGTEFLEAKWAMLVLVVGQIVNVGSGCVGYLMQITGHNYQCTYVYCWGTLINLVLSLILIPLLGILGGAIATATTMIIWNIWLHHLVVKHIGVRPSIFSLISTVTS